MVGIKYMPIPMPIKSGMAKTPIGPLHMKIIPIRMIVVDYNKIHSSNFNFI